MTIAPAHAMRATMAAWLALPLLLTGLPAGEAPGLLDDKPGAPAETQMRKAQVTALLREGDELLRLFNQDKARNPTAVVDAAIAFGKARQLLEKGGSEEDIAQVQASLFWCKKQMDVDALKDYLGRKGEDGKMAVAQAESVAAMKVETDQAATYLARAERFASSHAGKHLQIAVRFIEVAERFPGTAEGTAANRRALEAQQAMIAAFQAEALAARATRFTKPVEAKPGQIAVPDAAAQREALALIRKNFAKGYARKDTPGKRSLARKLLAESASNAGSPAIFHQCLAESQRLAGECEDYETLLTAIERQSSHFAGLLLKEELRTGLRKLSGKATAQAILKLLDEPSDPAANLAAGRWYAFTARRWQDGLPMLAMGSDAAIAKAAQMELDKPSTADERNQLAEVWFELGKKAGSKEDRAAMMRRAMTWYLEVLEAQSGMQKDITAKRIAEIDKLLPLDLNDIDWKALTAGQWEKLKAPSVTVLMRNDRTDSQIVLGPQDRVRVVAHPTETWTVDLGSWYGGMATTTWEGKKQSWEPMDGTFRVGAMVCWADNGAKQNCGIIKGPGKLYVGPFNDWYGFPERKGSIRVKFIPVTEDDE
jgi:hypothetical protein